MSASSFAARSGVALLLGAGVGMLGGTAGAQRSSGLESSSPPYRIECPAELDPPEEICAADLLTYIGWRVFDRHCTACHGQDALGSTFAPNLVHRVAQLDRRKFYAALDDGYAGRLTAMRPWGENPEVARHYADLWSYLSARAAGDLPAGPLRPLRTEGSQ